MLRDKILKHESEPGEKISVDEVAGALGVSRTPVVSAVQRLASEGLVEIVPQRGTFVTQLTTRDVAELFEICMMIEVYAAESILKAGKTGQFLEDVRGSMAAMEQATVNGDYSDYEAFLTGDRDLHLALVKLTENQHLIQIYGNLSLQIGDKGASSTKFVKPDLACPEATYVGLKDDSGNYQRGAQSVFWV